MNGIGKSAAIDFVPGASAKDKLTTADRVLATVLYLRRSLAEPWNQLSDSTAALSPERSTQVQGWREWLVA
ncbi:hypothetical protein [Streptomyces sp. NBC_01643]|uniref:hypothetical protein n=1 Tax=Streptomyces sp. NBC_01643 TaxID=2975906 RepID=UPI002F91960D|nr:hypothetical protein OHB03_48380 [Streptomyces sp. NBC_01643]